MWNAHGNEMEQIGAADLQMTWERSRESHVRGARKPAVTCRDAMVLNLFWGVGCVIAGGRIFPCILIVCCGRNEEGEFTSIIFLFL
jgi:hypothetical protein